MEKNLSSLYKIFLDHPQVTTDSRAVPQGSIFFALKGEQFDGNRYAQQALRDGAGYAVVDDPSLTGDERLIVVADVLATLQTLAHHHRSQFNIPVLGITGTNGKTTTKELIHAVLSRKFNTLATRGNLNNHIGVPLTLLGINNETEIAVIEMGANHQGEIDQLCRIADPGLGIITNVGKAHLEGFGSFEGVIQTKTELYRYLASKNGTLFLNNDDPILSRHAEGLNCVTYGSGEGALSYGNLTSDPYVGMDFRFANGKTAHAATSLYGLYNAPNLAAAACIGQYFGVPNEDIIDALTSYQPANNRSQVKQTARNLLILDAYNANPTSMRAALETFRGATYEKKVVILGDMRELGADSDAEHRAILEFLDQCDYSEVMLVGPVFTRLNTARRNLCFDDSDLARLWLEHHTIEGATVLIKGSRGIRLEKLTDTL